MSKKYNFDFSNLNLTKEEIKKEFEKHLKRRKLSVEDLKNSENRETLLYYFEDIIENKNIMALKLFKDFGITADFLNYKLNIMIKKIKNEENFKDFLTLFKEMHFFDKVNLDKENSCILSPLINTYDNVIEEMVKLGVPKKIQGDNNYMKFLLKTNDYEKVENVIANHFEYSLENLLTYERTSCDTRKKLTDKIKTTYLLLDNSIDSKEIKKRYAEEFLYVIVGSPYSTKEMIEEYLKKYDCKISENLLSSIIFYIDLDGGLTPTFKDKFLYICKNLDNKKEEQINKKLTDICTKLIKTNKGVELLSCCLNNDIPILKYLESEIPNVIPDLFSNKNIKGLKLINKISPDFIIEDKYENIINLSFVNFIKNHVLFFDNKVSSNLFRENIKFINEFFLNKTCINTELQKTFTKSTLFTIALSIKELGISEKILKHTDFNVGENVVLFFCNTKTDNLDKNIKLLKKIKKGSKLDLLEVNFFEKNIKEIQKDPETWIKIINTNIEKKLLMLEISNKELLSTPLQKKRL